MSCIWRFMYRDVLEPGDNFTMMMRKMVIAGVAIIGIVPVMIIIQALMGLLDPLHPTTYPRFIAYAFTMIGSWVYVKWTHTAPSWLISFWINSMGAVTLINTVTSPNGPYGYVLTAIILMVLLFQVPSVNLVVPVTGLLITGYNFSFGRAGLPLMMLPDGLDSPPGDLVYGYAQGIACLLMTVYLVHLQSGEFTRASLAATAANEMSLEVSQKLALYDTDGARAVLAAYASRDQVDGALITSFGTIVTNLEKYRRHLPNYVLNLEEEEEEEEEDLSDDGTTPNASAPATPLQQVVLQAPDQSEESSANQVVPFVAPRRASHVLQVGSPRNQAGSPRNQAGSPRNRRASPVLNTTGLVVEGQVTFSIVHYNGPDTAMTPFVDRVHAVAQETFGSVHSFIADTVHLTWNAGRRICQHETKAASFLCRLRENVGDPLVTVSGVVASGKGRFQKAGGTLQAVLVRVDWLPLLHKLHTIAKTHGALLLDKNANETAKFNMKTQCVDCVGESMVWETMVFELLGERESEDQAKAGAEGDEWMYILEQQDLQDTVRIAVAMCKRGEYSEALEALETQAGPSAMVRRLEQKARRCLVAQVPPKGFPHFEFA